MIDLTWLAGPLGLVGLAVALVMWRGNRVEGSGTAAAAAGADLVGPTRFLTSRYPIIVAVAVLIGALLWPTVDVSTALAALCGALLAVGAGAFASRAVEDGRLDLSSGTLGVDPGGARRAITGSSAVGLAVASVGLLGLGVLYVVLVHSPAAFLQSELVDFGNIAGGLAVGVSVVALLIAVVSGTLAGAAGAYGASAIRTPESPTDTGHREVRRLGAIMSGSAGSATELLQSYLCAAVAAIVIAGTGTTFSSQRVDAVALPILIGAVGLVASIIVLGAARAVKQASPAGALRTLGLLATALFLVLAYLTVAALGMEGRDPFTGRDYLVSGPFWAILAGSLAGVATGFATEFYTSWRPARRLAEGSGRGLGPTILWGLALSLESVLLPTLLVAVTVLVAYYFAGAYGIAMAAVGMLATVGMTMTTAAFGPIAGSSTTPAETTGRGDDRSMALGIAAIGESAEAIARGVSVTSAGITSLALLTAYGYATGLWGVGIDLQSPLVLIGLLVGAALPMLIAALLLAGGRRTSAGLISEPRSSGSAEAAQRHIGLPSADAHLARKMILPTLIAIVLPPLFGYLLGVQSVAGLIAGAALSSLLIGLFLANTGSTLINTSIFIAANATAAEVHHIGTGSADFGRALRDGCVGAISVIVKLMGILSIVLIPWFVRILQGA